MRRRVLRFALCMLLIVSMFIAPVSAMAASKIVSILKVTVQYGRLREGPSSDYDVVTTLDKGDRVLYLGEKSGAFCLVRTSRGETGYIYRGFLQSYGAARLDQLYYAERSGVRVYKSASTGSGRAGTLSDKQHVIVYKTSDDGWAYLKTLSGKGGYAKLSDLQKLN